MANSPTHRSRLDVETHSERDSHVATERDRLLGESTTNEQAARGEDEAELSRLRLFALTCTLGGLQVVWAILFSNINLFLVSIGFSKSISATVWVIAPLCGTIVQPVVGWLSDRSTSRFGRRKPFIVGGSIGTTVCFIGLTWSKDIARALGESAGSSTICTAVALAWIILLNTSVQPLQMGIRALVVDGCPKSQQPQANAWAGGALGVGNVFGYLVSFATDSMDIKVQYFDRYKLLAIIASVSLIVTVCINLPVSVEKYGQPASTAQKSGSVWSVFSQLRRSRMVSVRAKIVNRVQLCAWLGWFPFLFYTVAFVSSLAPQPTHMTEEDMPQQTESGTLAAFLYACASCLGSLLIPQLLRKTKSASSSTDDGASGSVATMLGVSLERVWFASQILFGVLMLSTIAVFEPIGATVLVTLSGLCFSLSNYIPYALIGIEVAAARTNPPSSSSPANDDHNNEEEGDEEEDESSQAVSFGTGATQGMHNAAISAPQILAAFASSGVLAVASKLGSDDGYGWVFRLCGLAALVAAWQVRNLFR